jgi:fructoselysine-6-P-deglycase FrlB-like protein
MVACHLNFQFQAFVVLKETKELGMVHYIVDAPRYPMDLRPIHMQIMYMQALCNHFSRPLAQNFARTRNMKFKIHYLFLKVCKNLIVQSMAYRKQPNIQ